MLASSSTMRMSAFLELLTLLLRSGRRYPLRVSEIDNKGCAASRLAVHANRPMMVAHHRLYDCESQSRAVLLGRVVRGENPVALFRSQAGSSIADLSPCAISGVTSAKGHVPPWGMASIALSTRLETTRWKRSGSSEISVSESSRLTLSVITFDASFN